MSRTIPSPEAFEPIKAGAFNSIPTNGDAWQNTLANVREDYPRIDFPNRFPFPAEVETLLSQKYWEVKP